MWEAFFPSLLPSWFIADVFLPIKPSTVPAPFQTSEFAVGPVEGCFLNSYYQKHEQHERTGAEQLSDWGNLTSVASIDFIQVLCVCWESINKLFELWNSLA